MTESEKIVKVGSNVYGLFQITCAPNGKPQISNVAFLSRTFTEFYKKLADKYLSESKKTLLWGSLLSVSLLLFMARYQNTHSIWRQKWNKFKYYFKKMFRINQIHSSTIKNSGFMCQNCGNYPCNVYYKNCSHMHLCYFCFEKKNEGKFDKESRICDNVTCEICSQKVKSFDKIFFS